MEKNSTRRGKNSSSNQYRDSKNSKNSRSGKGKGRNSRTRYK